MTLDTIRRHRHPQFQIKRITVLPPNLIHRVTRFLDHHSSICFALMNSRNRHMCKRQLQAVRQSVYAK